MKCLNNDPIGRKILLQVHWSNYKEMGNPEFEKCIFSYDSVNLENFSLLNPYKEEVILDPIAIQLSGLKKQMKVAIQNDDFEQVDDLQRQVDSINKKGNKAPSL